MIDNAPKPRIAICGIHIESSTFSPHTSTAHHFEVTRGESLLGRYEWMDEPWAQQINWLPVFHARALPGGPVDPATYAAWKTEILDALGNLTTEMPLDGLFFDIHGAMSVRGMWDAEGDLAAAIRDVIGDTPLVSASMDLHGNVSEVLFDACDLMTCYRTAPHEDGPQTRRRAARNLADRILSGKGKPAKALVPVPILLSGEKTSTRVQPAKRLYKQVEDTVSLPGVLDGGLWIGFAWADEPRSRATVVFTGDEDDEVERQALLLAQRVWDAREEFQFVAPTGTLQECLDFAEDARRPTLISDSGDNPGAGGAGDATYTLEALLNWPPSRTGALQVLYASIADRTAVQTAIDAGVGAQVTLDVGANIDNSLPGPQTVSARVLSVADDPRGGPTVALKVGGLTLVVTSQRNQYTQLEQFAALGLDPTAFDVVVVKIGYLEPDLYALQSDWMLALTPGSVDQNLSGAAYHHLARPVFPFDTFEGDPALTARHQATRRRKGRRRTTKQPLARTTGSAPVDKANAGFLLISRGFS